MYKNCKVLVYGLGHDYRCFEEVINSYFDVIGFCDKKYQRIPLFISVDRLRDMKFDYIYISSRKYYEEIKEELLEKDIKESQLIGFFDLACDVLRALDSEYALTSNYSLFREIHKMTLIGMNMYGGNSDFNKNGESEILRYVKNKLDAERIDNPIIFDGGANVGLYAKEVISVFDTPEIHCFEPCKTTYQKLSENLSTNHGVIVNNLGLSERIGSDTLYYNDKESGLSSLFNRQISHLVGFDLDMKEEVELTTIDEYCEKNNISNIDLLKLDIEGGEFAALLGARKMLCVGG